eukprot:gene21455-28424_t
MASGPQLPAVGEDENAAATKAAQNCADANSANEATNKTAASSNPLVVKYEECWKGVQEIPSDFALWTTLIAAADKLDEIERIRKVFEDFLKYFPLCYGYWKKYADAEGRHGKGDSSRCIAVFERGVAATPYSIDLWGHYATYKKSISDSPDEVRRIFERGLSYCGTDYGSHGLWDKYLAFEEEQKNRSNMCALYCKALACPQKELDKYWTGLQAFASTATISDLMTDEEARTTRAELASGKEGSKSEVKVTGTEDPYAMGTEPADIKMELPEGVDPAEGAESTDTKMEPSEGVDPAEGAAPADINMEPGQGAEPTDIKMETAEKAEPADIKMEPTEEAEPADIKREPGEGVEPAEGTEPAEEAEPADIKMETAEEAEPADIKRETAEEAEPTERAEPAEGAEPTEGAEPAERAEPTEGAEPAEGAEPTEGAEPAEGAEPTEGAEPAEGAEPTEGAEPAERVEPAEEVMPAKWAETAEEACSADAGAALVGEDDMRAHWLKMKEEVYQATKKRLEQLQPFLQHLKRPYFHVKPLDSTQLATWIKFLDFLEKQGDNETCQTTYERCLVPCASYPEFWERYATWLESKGLVDIAESAVQRLTSIFCRNKPQAHLFAARFDERRGLFESARDRYKLGFLYEERAKEEPSATLLPFVSLQYSTFLRQACHDLEKGRKVLETALGEFPGCKMLWEGAVSFEESAGSREAITHALDLLERCSAPPPANPSPSSDAVPEAKSRAQHLETKDREEMSSWAVELARLHGTSDQLHTAERRHFKLFSMPACVVPAPESKKRPSDRSNQPGTSTAKVAKIEAASYPQAAQWPAAARGAHGGGYPAAQAPAASTPAAYYGAAGAYPYAAYGAAGAYAYPGQYDYSGAGASGAPPK